MYLTMYLQVTQVLICGILVDSVVSTYLTSQSKPITIKKKQQINKSLSTDQRNRNVLLAGQSIPNKF